MLHTELSALTAALLASTDALVVVTILPRGSVADPRYSHSSQMSSLFGSAPALTVPYTVAVTLAPVVGFQITMGSALNGRSHCALAVVTILRDLRLAGGIDRTASTNDGCLRRLRALVGDSAWICSGAALSERINCTFMPVLIGVVTVMAALSLQSCTISVPMEELLALVNSEPVSWERSRLLSVMLLKRPVELLLKKRGRNR